MDAVVEVGVDVAINDGSISNGGVDDMGLKEDV